MYSVSCSRHSSASQFKHGEGPSQVKLQPGSSLVLPKEGQLSNSQGLRFPSGLLNLGLSCFPPRTSTPHQLMLMSVLTCLFESLNHVLR